MAMYNENGTGDADPAIELKTYSREFDAQLQMLGIMGFLFCTIAVFGGVFGNQWHVVPIALVVVGVGAVVEVICKRSVSNSIKTYQLRSDRLTISEDELVLDRIDSIQWPEKPTAGKLNLEINYRFDEHQPGKEIDTETGTFPFEISFTTLKEEDRLLLIQYLQQIDTEHLNWDRFCCRYLDRWLPVKSEKYFPEKLTDRLERNPFWAALLCMPQIVFVFLARLPGVFYFGTAAALAISTIVNLRLMHGSWLSPIGETILAGAAALFLCGIVTSFLPQMKAQTELEPAERKAGQHAVVILILEIILAPLIAQLSIMLGMKVLAIVVLQLSPWLPCAPLDAMRLRREKEKKKNPQACLERSTKKWKSYCKNFSVPSDQAIEVVQPNSNATIPLGNLTGQLSTIESAAHGL